MHLARFITLIVFLISTLVPFSARAASMTVVISEVQTATAVSASQEFVELYNASPSDMPLTGWTIEYKAATSPDVAASWSKRATLAGVIRGYGFYLAAPKTYLANADTEWSATLAGSAGNIRVKDGKGVVVDRLGYGQTANASESAPAAAPPTGQSLERLPGRLNELAGNGTDTDNNTADFVLRATPLAQSTASSPEAPVVLTPEKDIVTTPPPATVQDPVVVDDAPAVPVYASVDISELLPNPMAPLVDSHDEFVELHNPNPTAINLAGYTLRTGLNFHDFHILPSITVAPDAYFAVYASQTKMSLLNAGSTVQILDPSGELVDQTSAYAAAPNGQAWAKFGNTWRWTLQTTPSQPNVLVEPLLIAASTAKLASKTSESKPRAEKAAVVKPKATTKKAAVAKPPKSHKLPAVKLASAHAVAPPNKVVAASWLIGALFILTIGYILYEFRYDIYNYYYRLRANSRPRA